MQSRSSTFARNRAVLAATGVVLVVVAAVYLLGPWRSNSLLPLVVCSSSTDIACTNDYLLGRNGAQNLKDLIAGSLGVLGGAALLTSVIWTMRVRPSTPVA